MSRSIVNESFRYAELRIILANEGPEAFKPELYGREIQIIRRIGPRQSSYRIRSNLSLKIARNSIRILQVPIVKSSVLEKKSSTRSSKLYPYLRKILSVSYIKK